MVDVEWHVDFRKLNRFTAQLSQMATSEHRAFLQTELAPEIARMMMERLQVAYTTEVEGGGEEHTKPTVASGNYMRQVKPEISEAGQVVRVRAGASYSGYVESDSFAATGQRMSSVGRKATAAAFASAMGRMSGKSQAVRERAVDAMLNNNGQDLNELQRQLIRWCALKFPGNNRRMSAVINKVLEQGYAGRFLMASAFTERTAGGAAFQARLRETYRARYTEFLLNLFRKAAS